MGFFKNLLNTIAKAARPIYTFKDNNLLFKISSDEIHTYFLDKYDLKTRHDPYVFEAYTLSSKDIFLEYIKVDSDTSWNGSAINFYESFFKDELKIKTLKTLEDEEVDTYVFKVFEVNEQFILFFIYIYEVNKDIFIIDSKGDLYKNLISKKIKDYAFKYEESLKGEINFDISLVKKNSVEEFFTYERD